jgi:hypothetical protein
MWDSRPRLSGRAKLDGLSPLITNFPSRVIRAILTSCNSVAAALLS